MIVASNLFGDILTDLGAAVSGSLGIAPGANIDPARQHPSMFEPIHGSAPDIAGKGIANPIGAIWAGALMLDHLGHRDGHDRIVGAIERVVASGKVKTPDLGGGATTEAGDRRGGVRDLRPPLRRVIGSRCLRVLERKDRKAAQTCQRRAAAPPGCNQSRLKPNTEPVG